MKPISIISQDVFDKIRSRFQNLEMGDETGAVTIDPAEARFFDFDFVNEGVNLGRVSISLNDVGSLKVYYSQGITENQDDPAKQMWYNFLREMRGFAMRRLLRFDTRDIAKNNLDKNDFKYLSNKGTEEKSMNMNESRWNTKSSKKTSRAVRGNTEVIVRHARPVDEMYPGSRSQKKNIKAIFIQNRDGERFKYPFIHPAGAFAMAQHVDHGGIPHDPAGKAIVRMSEQIAQLQEFSRQVQHTQLHDDAMSIASRAQQRLTELKRQIEALGKRHHYESWMENFGGAEPDMVGELDDVTMETYKQTFTQTNFKEEIAKYFPLIHSIMSEENSVDLDDYVKESEETDEAFDIGMGQASYGKAGPEQEFEEWAEATEQGKLTDDQIQAIKQAIAQLPNGELELGPNGQTAWDFFNELGIDSTDLEKKFSDMSEIDNTTNAMEVFKAWAQEDYPELLVALGMSRTEKPEQAPEPEQAPAEENTDMVPPNTMMEKHDPQAMIKEIAEKVKSYYNKDNPNVGPFHSNEGIAIEVRKDISEKFGEEAGMQAEELAKKFMEKLTNEWQQRHGKNDDDGLARLKELVGNIKQKVEGIGDSGNGGVDFNRNIMPAEDVAFEDIMKLAGLAK